MPEYPHRSMLEFGLFTGAEQHENFSRISELVPNTVMSAATQPRPWPQGEDAELPTSYDFEGVKRSTTQFLADTDTAALLVLQDGAIRFEKYWLTGGVDVPWLSMSVAKSFVSALVGIALEEKLFSSIDESISAYVPVEPGSAYDGVSIRDVLHMSSGARWNEDYSDTDSDIFKLSGALVGEGNGLDGFIARMTRESEPETVCRYNSGETQVLGAFIARVTGRSLSEYMREKLIEPLGFEADGTWITDSLGTEMSFAGLNLISRDYARLGELYRNGGNWFGEQVVPESWVKDSVTVDSPIREAGAAIVGTHPIGLGYGYQWWVPNIREGEFAAIGVYNQLIYVLPEARAVIVKLSANRKYGTSPDEATNQDVENVACLRAIAESL
ncbi:serine hydrolase domain-containing protein [Arthrobacter sp. 2RAF6]|uniref:serine hydrolase domain-containing protein n=1 Tax=Arthrobacter sp. 2RAF6 TaxID=3233002 RepID=UPI003F91D885